MTTTAFCTVDRVTSGGLLSNCEASICRVHDIPKREVAGESPTAGRRRVKYEKSSVELHGETRRLAGMIAWGSALQLTREPHRSGP